MHENRLQVQAAVVYQAGWENCLRSSDMGTIAQVELTGDQLAIAVPVDKGISPLVEFNDIRDTCERQFICDRAFILPAIETIAFSQLLTVGDLRKRETYSRQSWCLLNFDSGYSRRTVWTTNVDDADLYLSGLIFRKRVAQQPLKFVRRRRLRSVLSLALECGAEPED